MEAEAVLPGERVVSSGPSAQGGGALPVGAEAVLLDEGVPSGPSAEDEGVPPAEAEAVLPDEAEAVLPEEEVVPPRSPDEDLEALLEAAEAATPEEAAQEAHAGEAGEQPVMASSGRAL